MNTIYSTKPLKLYVNKTILPVYIRKLKKKGVSIIFQQLLLLFYCRKKSFKNHEIEKYCQLIVVSKIINSKLMLTTLKNCQNKLLRPGLWFAYETKMNEFTMMIIYVGLRVGAYRDSLERRVFWIFTKETLSFSLEFVIKIN